MSRTDAAATADAAAPAPPSSSSSSIAMKMAPGPDNQRQEPDNNSDSVAGSLSTSSTTSPLAINNSNSIPVPSATASVNFGSESGSESQETVSPVLNNTPVVDSKQQQEEAATLSALNEGELRALLDEAITYKCPKDREGKSNLFKELLEEAEADETEEGRWTVSSAASSFGSSSSRGTGYLPGSNRSRRNRRDGCSSSVSEHLTHGGSLQNLARDDFEGCFAYLTNSTYNSYVSGIGGSGSSKRRLQQQKRHGESVSARQREGGSLPSNVNASHTLASLANFDLLYEKKFQRGQSEEKHLYNWTNKEKSKSFDKSSYSKKEDKERDKKDIKLSNSCDIESELRDKRSGNKDKLGTNEMLDSDNSSPEYNKQDCVVIGLDDFEATVLSEQNASAALGAVPRPRSLDAEDDEGTEMKVIDNRRPVQFITRATFDIPQTPVDANIEFPAFREHTTKLDKSKINANGCTEGATSLPFPLHNNVKCIMSGPSNVYSVMNWPAPNIPMVSTRFTAQHIAGKDSSLGTEKKSLDENGNSVQGYAGERKKPRRKNTQDLNPNVKVYMAKEVPGHRDEEDIDSLLSFIENKEVNKNGTKNKQPANAVKVKAPAGPKSRSRDKKDNKREEEEEEPIKLRNKSNSLTEISKTKLEDLTTEKSQTSSGSSSVSSQHGSINNVALRRLKQRSTGDASDSRGDRRSWGTGEGQSIYCNETGVDYRSRRGSVKKNYSECEAETEFHVVTNKKKKPKKQQRRSSSGGRTQVPSSGSYLQRDRGFSNDYRSPLSPELRRKSASSMPPSDKSDSSDSDSVHSLPVTSNSSKTSNSPKTASSSSNAPQASYADIARMATLNMSNPVMNISNIMPNMINTTAWPTVASSKSNPESEKLPNDYYPSLDELQHTDRKVRQHNLVQQGTSHSLDKPPSPTMSKTKTEVSSKKTEAQEEAISKVVKYVQDIEKMHQNQSQPESKPSNNNSSPITTESISTNPLQSKLPESASHPTPLETEGTNTNNGGDNNSGKELSTGPKNNGSRIRKIHPNSREFVPTPQSQTEDNKKVYNSQTDEQAKLTGNSNDPVDDKDNKKVSGPQNLTAGPSDTVDSSKSRSNTKSVQSRSVDGELTRVNKTEKIVKNTKDHPQVNYKDNSKEKPVEDIDGKKTKQSVSNKPEKEQKSPDAQNKSTSTTSSTSSRPAVILLDEKVSDQNRSTDLEFGEFTFGFEINEQLLQSKEDEENEEEDTEMVTSDMSHYSNSPASSNRAPIMFEKQVRYPPNINYIPVHTMIQGHPSMILPALPYINYPVRCPLPYMVPQQQPPPPPPTTVMEKCRNQSKEDFSSRYIAPDESHVQNFNHDKIVSFVGLAWDDVMRETGNTSSGRVQYYSGE